MNRKQQIMWDILDLTKKPGLFRTWFIGFIFPEFYHILERLSILGGIIDREVAQDIKLTAGK